jgi:peptide/nickel transport system substrate-binding protein
MAPWLRRLLFVAVLAISVAGCSPIATPRAGGNPGTIHGVLRITGVDEPDNLNPLLGYLAADTDLSMFWAGYLFNWSDRDRLVPELAERVPTQGNGDISHDGLTIVYHLRRNVRWQDGAPFTADDVIYTWQQTMNPRNLVVTRIGYDEVRAIERRNDYTIAVHLRRRFAPFVATFFTMGNHPVSILPRHILARYADLNRVSYNDHPIGTGPFRLVSYDRGVSVRFAANKHYWRGPPRLREVDVRFVPDVNTILTLALRHEIDLWIGAAISDRWNQPGA